MCGLTGFIGAGGRADLEAMAGALLHRGPDDAGFHIEPGFALHLGFRRLAIVDIEGGHQPMWNEDGSVCVLCNGEIYNQAELRAELLSKGHVFRSDHSDTEVLVHGYEEWGEDLPARLNGMFALVVWDRPRQRLFAARDRFGEKPFFYVSRPGFFAFASELSALIRHHAVDRTIDPRALQKFFAYGYIPAPGALYRGARKLPGGCCLTVDLASFCVREHRYWKFAIEADEHAPEHRIPELTDELRALLDHAVARRLVSDVPLGIFLSGGIDSNIVLALAARHRPAASLDTFTIGFNEPSFDESAHARAAAAAIGSRHHERILDFDTARDLAGEVLARLDEPTGDASILPTYLLAGFARESVTVALSGDGGDELFAGYDPFAALGPAAWYDRLVPPPVHLVLRRLAGMLPHGTSNMSLDFKLRRGLMGLSYPSSVRLPVWMSPLEPARIGALFDEPMRTEELYSEALEAWDNARATNPVDRSLEFFTNFYLQDDILAKTDRAAMQVSLEARAVFLDNEVVDFCARLPHGYKYRRGVRKFLLRRAAEGLVPDTVLQRPKKGFGIPFARWLRQMPAMPPLAAIPGLRTDWIVERWFAARAGEADERLLLWSWLSLQGIVGQNRGLAVAA
ncbi:MAG TPA: asparagine synthase (glutamine-hydrolyzing) [Acetobacteraceae bacterium]|nr:asparagine synthase (glutamine-hydrolyzing) [Acetobacteraceae bacterium]